MRSPQSMPTNSNLVQKRAGSPFEFGIASLIFGVVACLMSWAPVVGQFGLIVGGVGALMGLVGLVASIVSKGRGVVLGIAGAILCAVAIVVYFQMAPKYEEVSKNLEDLASSMDSLSALTDVSNLGASNSSDNTSNTSANTSTQSSSSMIPGQFSDMNVGATATLGSGLTVTVDSVQTGLTNFDNTPVTMAAVTYRNEGDSAQAYNVLDWLGENAEGVQGAPTFYSEAENELGSGTLVAGGSVSGNVYFDGDMLKILFQPTMSTDNEVISWLV